MGFVWGRGSYYWGAILYPLLVLGLAALLAGAAGAWNLAATDWKKAWINCALVGGSTILAAILTEEGFFRLWHRLVRPAE